MGWGSKHCPERAPGPFQEHSTQPFSKSRDGAHGRGGDTAERVPDYAPVSDPAYSLSSSREGPLEVWELTTAVKTKIEQKD